MTLYDYFFCIRSMSQKGNIDRIDRFLNEFFEIVDINPKCPWSNISVS